MKALSVASDVSNMANAKEPKAHTGNPAMLSTVRCKPSPNVHHNQYQIQTLLTNETLRQSIYIFQRDIQCITLRTLCSYNKIK